jgi:hypothetical protein
MQGSKHPVQTGSSSSSSSRANLGEPLEVAEGNVGCPDTYSTQRNKAAALVLHWMMTCEENCRLVMEHVSGVLLLLPPQLS